MSRTQLAQKGITLVELMVVVAIVGLLSAVAAVTVSGDRYGNTEGFAAQIKTQLEAANQRAVARSRVQRVEIRERQLVHWEGCAPPEAGDTCPPTGMNEPDEFVVVDRISAPIPDLFIHGMTEQTERNGHPDPPGQASLPGVIDFFPDGTAEPATVFVDHEHRTTERHRIGVFPASGYVNVWQGWD